MRYFVSVYAILSFSSIFLMRYYFPLCLFDLVFDVRKLLYMLAFWALRNTITNTIIRKIFLTLLLVYNYSMSS